MIFAGIFPHVCMAHGKERLIDLHVFHTFSSYCVSKVTPTVCVKDTKCQPVKLSFLLYAEVAALQPPLTAQTLYKLLRESKPGTVAHLSQNQLGWVFSGKLHFLFCWLNIDLPFKPLWWYYSVKLIFLLLEPLKISYVVRNNLSLIKKGIELFWFFLSGVMIHLSPHSKKKQMVYSQVFLCEQSPSTFVGFLEGLWFKPHKKI